jgi:hypothetical protein
MGFFDSLKGGNNGRLGSFLFRLHHALEQKGDGAFAFCGLSDLGLRGEDA